MDEEYLWQSAINQGLFLSYILYIFLVLQDTCFSAGWKILNNREEFYQVLRTDYISAGPLVDLLPACIALVFILSYGWRILVAKCY